LSDAATLSIDASPSRERLAKSHGSVYIGTVAGSQSERATIAQAILEFTDELGRVLGHRGTFAKVELSIEIRDGKPTLCDLRKSKSLKPMEK